MVDTEQVFVQWDEVVMYCPVTRYTIVLLSKISHVNITNTS